MLDPQAILTQVYQNEAREEWLIVRAKDEARKIAIIFGIFAAILLFPELILLTLTIPYLFGYSDSNPFSLLLYSPWLFLPALSLPVALVYALWRSEKTKADAVLILLPEGIIECERWSNEQKHRITSFEYANLEEVTLKVERGTISFLLPQTSTLSVEECVPHIHSGALIFDMAYRDGRHEKWSIANKYLSQPKNMLAKRIVTDYARHAQRIRSSQIGNEQASNNSPK